MAKIDETFGSQIKGINEAIQKSSDSMITVQDAMTKLIDDISNAGQNAATDMSKKMEESMDRAALAQESMNNQLREFINELKRLFVEQQVEAKDAMNETMRSVMEELQKAINSIAEERGKQIDQDAKRTEDLTASTQNLYAGLSDSVTKLVEDIKDLFHQENEEEEHEEDQITNNESNTENSTESNSNESSDNNDDEDDEHAEEEDD
mgnify:CR=1 FL=1